MPAAPVPLNPAPPPPPPWRLRAEVVIVPALVPLAGARAFVPPAARVVPIWPGCTLGGAVFASYGPGSTLLYHEQLACAGLVALRKRIGLWVAHIHVDSAASREGGRRSWALPKELAAFERAGPRVRVRSAQGSLSVVAARPRVRLPLPAPVAFFGALEGEVRWTVAAGVVLGAPVRARVELPAAGPLAVPGLASARWALAGRAHIVVPAPRRGWFGGVERGKQPPDAHLHARAVRARHRPGAGAEPPPGADR